VPSVARMVSELEAQKKKNAQAQLVNDQLAAELRDLREGQAMIEEKARLELGMVKPNEIFVQITKK
jgi:cell division protein FtsB